MAAQVRPLKQSCCFSPVGGKFQAQEGTDMNTNQSILLDHVDARPVTGDLDEAIVDRNTMVQPRVFLENLADGVFLCTQYIRHHSTPLYTPEPDVVHEIIGHGVTLASERLAELNRLFGKAVKRTKSATELEKLSRVYWFTIEFGVLRENGKVKAY